MSSRLISIDIDCKLNEALIAEGLAREVVNRIQKTRKDLGLNVADRIAVAYKADARLAAAIAEHQDYIARETLCSALQEANVTADRDAGHTFYIDSMYLFLSIAKLD